MLRVHALTVMVVLGHGWLSGVAALESAVTFLLHNRELCSAVGSSLEAELEPAVRAGRRALARESLAIAEELLETARRGRSAQMARQVLELERRLCGAAAPTPGREALEARLEAAAAELASLVPVTDGRRERILARFLDRREEATMAAIAEARKRSASGAESAAPPSLAPLEKDEGSLREPEIGETTLEAASSGDAGEEAGAPTEATPTGTWLWDPSPEQLEQRLRRERRALRERLRAWGPLYERQVRQLAATRVRLASDLRERSLEQLQPVCAGLAGAVAGVDYAVVLRAPEAILRDDLDRMLAGYSAAGRLCAAGRFALAWGEITEADRRWTRLVARLSRLERGAAAELGD